MNSFFFWQCFFGNFWSVVLMLFWTSLVFDNIYLDEINAGYWLAATLRNQWENRGTTNSNLQPRSTIRHFRSTTCRSSEGPAFRNRNRIFNYNLSQNEYFAKNLKQFWRDNFNIFGIFCVSNFEKIQKSEYSAFRRALVVALLNNNNSWSKKAFTARD